MAPLADRCYSACRGPCLRLRSPVGVTAAGDLSASGPAPVRSLARAAAATGCRPAGPCPLAAVVAAAGHHISATEEAEDEGLPREQEAAFVADSVSLSADLSC